jgi:thymidylate synthase (FAD)
MDLYGGNMEIVKPRVMHITHTPEPYKTIEKIARTCYKSEDKIKEGSAETLIKKLISRKHDAMLEHASFSFNIICDRGISHELVRHRLFSFAQESTRYCNYSKTELSFIVPSGLDEDSDGYKVWRDFILFSEEGYLYLVDDLEISPQIARSVLPNSLKTEINVTGNVREWRHFLSLRLSKKAHPDMQVIAKGVYDWFLSAYPLFVYEI